MPNGANDVSPEAATLSILPVRTKADFKLFFDVTRQVYRDDPNFVQPLFVERMDHLNPKKNPAFDSMEVAYWVVLRGLVPVGRISGQINRLHRERYGDSAGHFGFFEAIDDAEVIELLLTTVEIWSRERGAKVLQGPFSLSINDESGLLIDGFETPPQMMMPHGRPYYRGRLEALGFDKAKDLIAYDIDVTQPWPGQAQKLVDRMDKFKGLRFRSLEWGRFEEEVGTICRIFNDAWSNNWNFIPLGDAEAIYLAKSIKPIVDADCFAIGELNGEPVAMAVTLPNLNEAIADLDGRLLPLGWAKLLYRLKIAGVKSWRMPLMGIKRSLQGSLKGAALTLGVIDRIKTYHTKNGVERGELSWILEDNDAIKSVIETVGGVPYKTYRVFERAIA